MNQTENSTIILDFDGTLFEHRFPDIGAPLDGAFEVVKELLGAQWNCIVSSCRNNPSLYRYPEERDENLMLVRTTLDEVGLERVAIDDGRSGKPAYRWTVDDKGIEFSGDWGPFIESQFKRLQPGYASGRFIGHVAVGIEGCVLTPEGDSVASAVEAIDLKIESRWRVTLTTTATSSDKFDSKIARNTAVTNIQNQLEQIGLNYHWLDDGNSGKPIADYYIEQHMIPYRGLWDSVLRVIQRGEP